MLIIRAETVSVLWQKFLTPTIKRGSGAGDQTRMGAAMKVRMGEIFVGQ
jgi:hypothetical protein